MKAKLVVVLVLASAVLAACGPSNREAPTGAPTVSVVTTLAPLPDETNTPAVISQSVVFVRAVDGDTIDVRFGDGTVERVRLIGMDTPERGDPCYREATEAIAFFEGLEVTLEKDVSERDRYGRLLRFVYIGELMLNEAQVANGWAMVYTYPPDVKYADRFVEAQRLAQASGLGLWGDNCKEGGGGPIPLPTGVGDISYPGTCTGPDLDCGDFSSHAQAQAFFEMCGGPNADPHKLDGNHDGSACESLP
jgi:micrococcal nuclease